MAKSPDKFDPDAAADPGKPAPDAPEKSATPGEQTVDQPGKVPEPAAPSGAEPAATPGIAPLGQGAQVVLTGDAQAAARGGTHGEIAANTMARDSAIAAGHIEPATAEAAADATAGHADELDTEEAEAMAKVKADFAAKRIERAAKANE